MENLSRIAQGIFLGNGEVWNFLDYAVNRNCGGLMVYTRNNNFLGDKLNNNFNSGFNARYKYNDIHTTEGYAIDRVWGGLRGAPRGFGGNIGDLYKVPDEFNASNSDINFITKEEYTEFQKEIRQKNLVRNTESVLVNETGKQAYREISVEAYAGQISDEWKDVGLEAIKIGDDVNLWNPNKKNLPKKYTLEEFGDRARIFKTLTEFTIESGKDSEEDNKKYTEFSVSYDHPIHYHNITAKVSERTFERLKKIEEVAKEKQETVRHYQSASQRFIELASKNVVLRDNVTFNGLLFEYTTEGTEIPSIPALKNYGLYRYYNNERLTNKGRLIFWKPNKTYGVEFNERGEEYYSVNETNKFKGEVPISSKFNGGEHSIYNVSDGTISYSFYQEAEKKGTAPTELKTSVSDGSSVSLTDYSNASRLLKKTNQLFKDAKIGSLINRFHTNGIGEGGDLITAYDETYGMSRGRNLLKKDENGNVIVDKSSGYENPYCRVWTAHQQYSKLKDRIRPFVDDKGAPKSLAEMQSNYGDLRTPEGKTNLDSYSVLRKDGFLRITPTHDKGEYTNSKDKIRNYMFSIENLAWRDITSDINSTALSTEQRGPNGGRIMWFPPYNLKFSENVNVNWNANSFIGRGEEIYTYTNTVRTGTLDFTILIDHPSILNKWRGTGTIDNKEEREKELLRFFAGCGNINDKVLPKQPDKEQSQSQEDMPKTNPSPVFHSEKIAYIIFFPNDFSGKDYANVNNINGVIEKLSNYNNGGVISERDKAFKDEVSQSHNLVSTGFTPSGYSQIIKQEFFAGYEDITAGNINYFSDLLSVKTKFNGDTIFGFPSRNCKINNIEIKGFASSHGYINNNLELCNRRRTIIKKLLESQSSELSEENVTYTELEGSIIQVNDIDGRADVNSIDAKLARAAYAIIDITWKEENVTHEGPTEQNISTFYGYISRENLPKTGDLLNKNMVSNVQTIEYSEKEYTYDNEYLYFSEIFDDKLVYKKIVDKVKYFDPAFHSITPEGFNARLTFLHQCTRQGPTNAVSSGRVKGRVIDEGGHVIEEGSPDYLKFAGNLAFGRAPYCILRIGDFFNTKICIDSMSISYDNNGIQWDLNPEGVGVQPMYANISISFKFLGGQDITKPIERLQNAVTSNYYANASIYSRHADNNNFYYDAFEDKPKEK